jgi:DMSO/TMAO reductase YedYZ molybdopterin-dependent catalytic subunit
MTPRILSASRRELLAAFLAAAVRPGRADDEKVVVPGKRSLILHNDRPEDLETPVREYDSWLTPVDAFFVRQHLPRPSPIDPAAYRLTVNGIVSKQLQLSLDDLKRLPQFTVPATIECSGNGRTFYTPKVPGIQWGRGAIGNAEWRGPAVGAVLKLAGVASDAGFLESDGADTGVASTPDFIRSMPISKAMHPATILALTMNGQPIPDIHGGPVRLIMPGWNGASFVKWVMRLSATAERTTGFFMNPAYRYPKYALPPGTPVKPGELEVIQGMPVKSSITAPEDQSKAALGIRRHSVGREE